MMLFIIYAIIMSIVVLFLLVVSSVYMLLLRFFNKAIYDVIDFFKNREANDKN